MSQLTHYHLSTPLARLKALEARLATNGRSGKPRKTMTIPASELNNLLQDLKVLREAITFAGATISK